jgi:arachidonate 15-lipoxygenase
LEDAVAEYLISQRDDRRQRAEQLAKMRESYPYKLDLGFPIAAGMREPDQPAMAWRLKALVTQETLRLNLRLLKRRGRWNFVNDLPPLDVVKLASLIQSQDIAGMVDYFMPLPGGVLDSGRDKSVQEFREVFALAKPPEAAFHFESDAYFAENMVAGPDPTRLVRLTEIPAKFPISSAHLQSVPELSGEDLASAIAVGRVYWIDHEAMTELENGRHP